MSRVERDPERGRAAAAKLKALGVKGILIKAAEQGYITQLACKMPECFCPEELGGACYFEPVTAELSDWMPTHEHFPLSKREGGLLAVDNAILAHRLCNRIDYSISVGRSYARDLERIRKAREEATRRNNVQIGNTEGGEIPTVVATVEADSESDAKKVYRKQEGLGQFPQNFFVEAIDESGEPVEETEPEAEAATPKPKKTKKAPEWKSLPDGEKAQYLLDHQTLSDRTWTDELRLKGEKRDAFIRRILLGEVLHGEAVESDETETVEETDTA